MIKKMVLYAIVLGAVSSCTIACGPLQPANQNQVGANRQFPPADPNQAMLNLLQQRTLERALKNWEAESPKEQCKCEPEIIYKERQMSCREIEEEFWNRCNGEAAKTGYFVFQRRFDT